MRGWRVVLLMWLLVAGAARAAEPVAVPTTVRLASEEWLDYTNADGSGLAWDVLRKVFEPAGVKVQVLSVPYSRAVGLVKRAEADAWVGSYHEESDDYLYPRHAFDSDHIYALGLASSPVPTLDTLGRYKLSWVRGYDYQHYLSNVKEFREVQRREGILPMLERKRVDFYIDAQTEVNYVHAQASDPARYRRTHLGELPLYLAFARTDQAVAIMELFDRRMDELIASGALREIFARWKQPYPFEAAGTVR
ncbi:substrate-binding periplasmic protein [Pseudomonas aegrilactucae]|uniref:Transporter substrate-binding domain-containing protein n=1 Tax=Pseudomonas aegrilactucae TaxID=2854028 RepID=A0A9Q2XGT4_9PSED|nr:transporter substrate-binding domain-containing protein [Pseudomonas aegrilactucae]MBV6286658.1 transporter substrate-binding domain-containing protein [Pseudomonas aegrilactucae]